MDVGAIVGVVAQVIGTVKGGVASAEDKQKAMDLIQAATDAYGKIQLPQLKELILKQQEKSGLGAIKDDPMYRDQQNAADASLGDIIQSGGLTLADKAALNNIRNRTAQTESAGRNSILHGMASRGTLDSGAQLAAQLQGNQQSANSLAQADESAAGQAQERAYRAIRDRSQMASQGLDRSYRQKSDAARANDEINRGNTAIMNTASQFNAKIPQQNFNNQLELTNAQTGAQAKLAAAIAGRAKDTQDETTGIGNMIGAGAKAFGSSSKSSGGNGGESNEAGIPQGSFDSGTTDTGNIGGPAFDSYPGTSSDALTSPSTRPGIGYDDEEDKDHPYKGMNY